MRASGGIRAVRKSDKGWIAERWTSFIGGFMIGARFDRGRTYANKGQVADVTVERGIVKAKVVGSRARTYKIEIKFQTLPLEAWRNIADKLRNDPLLCAQVLDDHFPLELESIFEREGASLFPQLENDSSMECSCPDWSVPCKHIVAVFILLGDAFGREPFLIFKLRGMERENFLSLLGSVGKGTESSPQNESNETELRPKSANKKRNTERGRTENEFVSPPHRTGECGNVISMDLQSEFADASCIDKNALILDEFGSFPFWKGERTIKEMLTPVYKSASEYADKLLDRFG